MITQTEFNFQMKLFIITPTVIGITCGSFWALAGMI